ncbi:MAG TPA: hypothetical protein VG734_15145 [Lacunisphaera sp.]|nr:hypothetical protein [Lacunisphaera sp.]
MLAFMLAGCGPSAAERTAKERERVEAEESARRDERKGNEAITEMNKKLGRKPPTLDLGVPTRATEPLKKQP